MWKPVPQLTNTWLQWGKSVFPAIFCKLFHPFILSYLHFSPPSFFVFPLLNASFIFLLCSGIFCTLDSIFLGCPSSYPSSSLNPWKRKFLYFPGSLEDLTVLPQNKDALCISPVCCIVLFNLRFFSSCHHAVLFVCLFSIRFDLFTVAGRAWKDRIRMSPNYETIYWPVIWKPFQNLLSLQDQGEAIAHTMTAQRSNARIEGLKAGTSYVVQVRARTVAGYGRYSNPADFSTNLQSMLLPYLFHCEGIY